MPETTLVPRGPRSAGAIPQRRVPQDWPKDRRFRVLSLDGGGIRGVFPATVLAELERRFCSGRPVSDYFDLIAGTSTGGILALGLGGGFPAVDLERLYVTRGCEIFPPARPGILGWLSARYRGAEQLMLHRYDREAISAMLQKILGNKLFGESNNRLCIPAFDGTHSEVFVYKTPHHSDYKQDRYETMVNVGLATSAAPTFFRPFENGGYQLVDGGIWANNPIMLAVIEALICFDISPTQIDVLSIGCGEDPYFVTRARARFGGIWFWKDSIIAAMRLQSMAATNQTRLLLGPPSVARLLPPIHSPPIALDDWRRSVEVLPAEAKALVEQNGEQIRKKFLAHVAEPYVPVPQPK